MDVTVRYEEGRSLKKAYKEKVDKKKTTAEQVRLRLRYQKAEIIPIVIGSRGAMPASTKRHLEELGFKKSDMMTMMVLKSSIEILNLSLFCILLLSPHMLFSILLSILPLFLV